MTLSELVCWLWFGPYRRPFRAVVRRMLNNQKNMIRFGPLKCRRFVGSEWPCILGIFELHIQRAMTAILSRGDVFYDVGAHIGFMSLLAADVVGPEGYVYAFEPLQVNAQRITQLMEANGIGNYKLIVEAVADKKGVGDLFFENGKPAEPSLLQGRRNKSIKVRTITLDEFAAENQWPSLVKVDVEGAERMVLNGSTRLLSASNAPSWIIEIHSANNDECVVSQLISYGYVVKALEPVYRRPRPYPRHVLAIKR